MKMNQVPFRCLFAVVVVFGLVLACEWEQVDDPKQELGPSSFDAGADFLDPRYDISDPEKCRQECCLESRCHMAMLGRPMDGSAQCVLVNCMWDGRDVCVLQPSTQYEVLGKKKPSDVTAPRKEPEPNDKQSNMSNPCREPMKVGSCRAYFPKYYYDAANQTCRMFIYGGCGKNGNNFDTLEECQATCSGDTDKSAKSLRMVQPFNYYITAVPYADLADEKERCEAEPDVGPCRAAFQHWYYDSEAGECRTFIYGGCRGNKNNYMTQQSCLDACQVTALLSAKKRPSDVHRSEKCMSAPDPGHCRAAFPAFYYDPDTASCQPFIYGGCGGNKNRYSSAEECLASCNMDGSFEQRDKVRSRWTAAFFVLLTLAAICILLVSSFIITMLRRLHFSRTASSVSDKEELLPDERSSQESLDIPETPTADKA
ncbi:kunitz-type protease inhibitor 2 [Dunckerocampus dactyliophorus]|uniref:kunitz-type protease inhibitor 2 n=1 Tax=Dunckerocampus dactyliophorus TaxID=161453 RepID=UPI002405206D|nr:kunitz-type protease inhibitor 2 [Dunckerocampus dactyliophorus]